MGVYAAPSTFKDVAELFVDLIKGMIAILFASLSVALVYGVILYFLNADNESKRTEIKNYLLWGVIGIIVVFGLWGILQILSDSMGWGTVGVVFLRAPAP